MSFNFPIMNKVFGTISTIIGASMIPSLAVALIYRENYVAKAFIITIIPIMVLGITLFRISTWKNQNLKIRDGFLIVTAGWILASLLGAIPYILSGVIPSFIDAFFESVSGFTATGATILDNVSAIPKSLLFWRSFCHWLGGMGILVLLISILPALGISGLKILKAETPGPTLEKMSTRMSNSARITYIIYLSFSVIEFVLLRIGGLSIFDSFIHTFGSISTGGLSNYRDGVAHFNSPYIEAIIIIFSILASINFTLYHHVMKGRWKEFFKDKELQIFLAIIGSSVILIFANLSLSGTYTSLWDSLRFAFFQASAFISTSGYSTANYSLWPTFSQMILFTLMFIGGCSASTAGSIKVIRVTVLFQLIKRGFYKRLHPYAVYPIKLGGKTISSETVTGVTTFTILYFSVFIISALVLSVDGHDLVTTLSAAAGALSNTGLGLGLLSPEGTYSIFSSPIRLYLSFLMIAGRLELYTIILLLTPSFWRYDRM
ncbi:MAG: TrkH family potassium uptake protein [Anaerovoracaceae bacterium]|jgi:trk system potassium uptake protein TrkH